jgi:hypothetical protein
VLDRGVVGVISCSTAIAVVYLDDFVFADPLCFVLLPANSAYDALLVAVI